MKKVWQKYHVINWALHNTFMSCCFLNVFQNVESFFMLGKIERLTYWHRSTFLREKKSCKMSTKATSVDSGTYIEHHIFWLPSISVKLSVANYVSTIGHYEQMTHLLATSTCTEWSITKSAGHIGFIFSGSPPSLLTASLMAAKSTTAGTPLQTTMRNTNLLKP